MNNKINNLSQINNNVHQNTTGSQFSNSNINLQNNTNESQFSFNPSQQTFPINNTPSFRKIIPQNNFNSDNQSGFSQNYQGKFKNSNSGSK